MKQQVTMVVTTTVCIVALGIAAGMRLSPVEAAEQNPAASADGHTMIAPAAMTWSPAGTGLSIAVLSGSPDREGAPFVIRHFGWTGVETVVQIHGVGPFKTYFVEQPAK